MSFNEFLSLCLCLVVATILGLYMTFYKPYLGYEPQPGDCLKYREARQIGLFTSSVECVEWKE